MNLAPGLLTLELGQAFHSCQDLVCQEASQCGVVTRPRCMHSKDSSHQHQHVQSYTAHSVCCLHHSQSVAHSLLHTFHCAHQIHSSFDCADEIDAIGKARGTGSSDSGTAEREQGLLQLLCELDGFKRNDKVLVIGATNRLDSLDDALIRPGRFDRTIYMGRPTTSNRFKILQVCYHATMQLHLTCLGTRQGLGSRQGLGTRQGLGIRQCLGTSQGSRHQAGS